MMGAENLTLNEQEVQSVDNSEKFKEEHDRLVGYCEKNLDTEEVQGLFSFLELDKSLDKFLTDFKNGNTEMLKARIIQNESQEKQSETITLTAEEIQEYVSKGEIELQKHQEKLEKVNQKLIQLSLILDISSMYKEYLENLLSRIKLKFASEKDERYEVQISLIETKVREINNITEYLNLLGNEDDLLQIDTQKLLESLLVSEEKIAKTGWVDQPISFMWNENNTVENVNSSYENIRNTLLNLDTKSQDINQIRLGIFEEFRRFDGLDDDSNVYNTSEAIRTRITPNILNNKDLNSDEFIKTSFDFIKNFSEEEKNKLYSLLESGENAFRELINSYPLINNLGLTEDKKEEFLEDLYDSLKDGKDNIEDEKIKKLIQDKVNNKINYLETALETAENREEIQEQIDELKKILTTNNLEKQVKEIKVETIFKSLERSVIERTLETKSNFVEKLSETNKDIALYDDIEGIGDGLSDETFNTISKSTQFLAEQIALMAISGIIGGIAVKVAGAGETVNLINGGRNLANVGNIGRNLLVEGGAFYLGYTGLNGLVNKKEWTEAYDDLSIYDAVRTVIFLGVLRAFGKAKEGFNPKDITIDTFKLLGTDLAVRGAFGEFTGKEGIEGIDFKDLSESDAKEFGMFLLEELAFIVPLLIGLRASEKMMGTTQTNNKNKVEVEFTQGQFNIKFRELKIQLKKSDLKIHNLKVRGKNTEKAKAEGEKINNEYKNLRDNNPEFVKEYYKARDKGKISEKGRNEPLQNQNETKAEPDKGGKSNADEGVNMNTGKSPKYLKLEKYAREVKEGKMDYVLEDKVIGKKITEKGIGKEGENVGKGLLEKSGFKEGEKIKPRNEFEKNALREMKEASTQILDEYNVVINTLIGGKNPEILKMYNLGTLEKIQQLMIKESLL